MSAPAPMILPAPPPVQSHWALFLDVDGCLLDFADRPEDVDVPEGLREALQSLASGLGGAVAFVSGRRIAQVDALFAPLRLPAAGLHGLELRQGDGIVESCCDEPGDLRNVREAAEKVALAHPGARVEDKGAAVALHWRAAPAARSPLEALAASALARLPGYRLQHGNCVVELRPAHSDKGEAVRRLMETAPFAGRLPVYAGDDLTDEDGFSAANRLGGLSVRVGDRHPSLATHALADTAALRDWLHEGVARLGATA
ncbi:trehalose-phosphatase [Cognatilysobacter lacus]|uniref:Trehalose 6-phosphate phosphatase n=1 Tax=Cognatilysobacter lacus TaxID=1643323 RepID=A0A5D8Z5G9_9GAMM|nr:trehalose-phosphatase [Lysobacter lacus]TZF89989.1 trehalose-phosphatase [Lysobacter lacus]